MKKKFSAICILISVSLLLVGCGSANTSDKTVSVVGSSSVAPLAEYESENFLRVDKAIEVDVQSVGSSSGIKAAIDGTANIGMSSRNLSEEEAKELKEVVIALDGIAVVVNPNNKVKNLTKDELLAIYQGKIRNWKDVGGDDAPIVVISREEGSGTRGAFEEITGLEIEKNDKKYTTVFSRAIITDGNGSVKQNIALKKNGIGYISVGSVDDSVKSVAVDGVLPTEETIKAGEYLISRPFLLLTKGDPTPEAQAFIDFILSDEGQKLVKEHNYITVN
ncbi:MAG: phosphate ABC transporter substrate-binding protein [Firmicutes bacterium]|nr:phosphate ABC transporter substrate-binding protein [Bacillota bacterium]